MIARKPDLKAPRAKTDAGYCPVNIAYWRKFKKESGVKCTYKEFSSVIKRGNELIADVVANERDGFKLMNNIGTLILVTCNPPEKYENFDYGKLNKEGVKVDHYNFDTNGKICKILYTTYEVREKFVNRKLWAFEGVREFKRDSSASFRNNYEMYKQVLYFESMSFYFKNEKRIAKEVEQVDYFKDE